MQDLQRSPVINDVLLLRTASMTFLFFSSFLSPTAHWCPPASPPLCLSLSLFLLLTLTTCAYTMQIHRQSECMAKTRVDCLKGSCCLMLPRAGGCFFNTTAWCGCLTPVARPSVSSLHTRQCLGSTQLSWTRQSKHRHLLFMLGLGINFK